jgi:hypothetical protein
MVAALEVVGEPDRDAARGRVDECGAQDGAGRIREPEVVDRYLERVLRRCQPGGKRLGDLLGGLAPVGEGADLDQEALAARSAALWARFAA